MQLFDLYTLHTRDYSPIDPSDPLKNTAKSLGPEFQNAYRWLYNLLGIERATWCYGSPNEYSIPLGREMDIYHLRVPESEVIAKVNSEVWYHIYCGINQYPEWYYDLRDPAFKSACDEWDVKHPKEQFWKQDILKVGEQHEWLIPNPIKQEWIVDVTHASGWEPQEYLYRQVLEPEDIQWLNIVLSRGKMHLRFEPYEDRICAIVSKECLPGMCPERNHPALANLDSSVMYL